MRIIWQKSVDTAEKIACVQTSPISLRLHAGNRKERLHIRKLAKFESDTTQRSEDIHVAPQVAKIHRRLCGGSKFVLCKIS